MLIKLKNNLLRTHRTSSTHSAQLYSYIDATIRYDISLIYSTVADALLFTFPAQLRYIYKTYRKSIKLFIKLNSRLGLPCSMHRSSPCSFTHFAPSDPPRTGKYNNMLRSQPSSREWWVCRSALSALPSPGYIFMWLSTPEILSTISSESALACRMLASMVLTSSRDVVSASSWAPWGEEGAPSGGRKILLKSWTCFSSWFK